MPSPTDRLKPGTPGAQPGVIAFHRAKLQEIAPLGFLLTRCFQAKPPLAPTIY